eukprot:scaffold931_cov383-Prasinococcus_capsulatus_cf.AAC.26
MRSRGSLSSPRTTHLPRRGVTAWSLGLDTGGICYSSGPAPQEAVAVQGASGPGSLQQRSLTAASLSGRPGHSSTRQPRLRRWLPACLWYRRPYAVLEWRAQRWAPHHLPVGCCAHCCRHQRGACWQAALVPQARVLGPGLRRTGQTEPARAMRLSCLGYDGTRYKFVLVRTSRGLLASLPCTTQPSAAFNFNRSTRALVLSVRCRAAPSAGDGRPRAMPYSLPASLRASTSLFPGAARTRSCTAGAAARGAALSSRLATSDPGEDGRQSSPSGRNAPSPAQTEPERLRMGLRRDKPHLELRAPSDHPPNRPFQGKIDGYSFITFTLECLPTVDASRLTLRAPTFGHPRPRSGRRRSRAASARCAVTRGSCRRGFPPAWAPDSARRPARIDGAGAAGAPADEERLRRCSCAWSLPSGAPEGARGLVQVWPGRSRDGCGGRGEEGAVERVKHGRGAYPAV